MLKLAWRNIIHNPLTTALSSVLFAISIIIIILLGIVGHQLEEKFSVNRKKVHLVVGAPGSKLDLILSSVYHITPPIQNINISDAAFILRQPSLSIVPIALGDHYAFDPDPGNQSYEDVEQRRIVGTDSSYLDLYNVKVEEGRLFNQTMEVVIGYEVASLGLKIGDKFVGTHGVGGHGGHVHEDQQYTVVGIMEASGTVLDQLILCDIRSVWQVHEGHGHSATKVITADNIVKTPKTPKAFKAALLSDEELASQKSKIIDKAQNIRELAGELQILNTAFWANESRIREQTIRLRSNIKALRDASRKIIQHDYAKDYGRIDSTFTVKDSLKTFAKVQIDILNELTESLYISQSISAEGLDYYAKEAEQIGYNIVNSFDLARHDSLIQERRKHFRNSDQAAKKHYLLDHTKEEVTALLISYKGSMGIDVQRIIAEHHPELNAAPVEIEIQKLTELIEPGVVYLRMLAFLIMIISGISILISLVKALRERKYEMALLRVMGATRFSIFTLVILEGLILSLAGFLLGFVLSHVLAEVMAGILENKYHYHFTGMIFLKSEWYVLLGTLGIGFVSALIPAMMAIYTNISSTLSKK